MSAKPPTQLSGAFGDFASVATEMMIERQYSAVPLAIRGLKDSNFDSRVASDYLPAGRSIYPGERPVGSFALDKDRVAPVWVNCSTEKQLQLLTAVHIDGKEEIWDLDDVLEGMGAASIGERYPVITFGSNANPPQLADKFRHLSEVDQWFVPTIRAELNGAITAYVARVGLKGYAFADLIPADDSSRQMVYLNFLSKEQFQAMDETEKAYDVAEWENVSIYIDADNQDSVAATNNRFVLPLAYLYVGRGDGLGAGVLLDSRNRPILLKEISDNVEAMSQSEVQEYIAQLIGSRLAQELLLPIGVRLSGDKLSELMAGRKDHPELSEFREALEKENAQRKERGEREIPLGRAIYQLQQKFLQESGVVGRSNIIDRLSAVGVDLQDRKTLSQMLHST